MSHHMDPEPRPKRPRTASGASSRDKSDGWKPRHSDKSDEKLTLHVTLPSGRSCSVTLPRSSAVGDVTLKAQEELQQAFLRLAAPEGRLLHPTESLEAFAEDDTLAAVAQQPLQVTVCEGAFAVWREAGDQIVTWGDRRGLNVAVREVRKRRKIAEVVATKGAWAAILDDRSVISWGGDQSWTHRSKAVQERLSSASQVKRISTTNFAFAALMFDGTVETWGDEKAGGNCQQVKAKLKNVREIHGARDTFLAIREDGTVVSWGDPEMLNVNRCQKLQNFRQICETGMNDVDDESDVTVGYAAILADGSAMCWGNVPCSDKVRSQLKDVKRIHASSDAFAAIVSDGQVVTWGVLDRLEAKVTSKLRKVRQIHCTAHAFAAVLEDGSCVTWGLPLSGGDSSRVKRQLLRGVRQICATRSAFAAVTAEGAVVTWGNPEEGGDSSQVQEQLRFVQRLHATERAFLAMLSDGTLVTWGDPEFGGDSRGVQERVDAMGSRWNHLEQME